MANKILLFVSSVQVLAAHWEGGKITRCEKLSPDEDGVAAFAGWLKSMRGRPVYIVADTVEEDYRSETLPHASGSDRMSLLDRKIRQYYRSTRFVSPLPRGRVNDKRRDDRYIFAALTNAALVDPWLAAATAHNAPVAGVFLSPLLTTGILAKLKIMLPRVLIAAPHVAGLRLTFYKDGEFCSSRLTRVVPGNADDAAHMLLSELSNTRLYLSNLHLDPIDEPLPVLFMDRFDTLAETVKRISSEDPGLACSCIDRATLLRQLAVSAPQLDLALETVYLPGLADRPPVGNLAPRAVTAGFQLRERKRSLYALSACVGAIGLLWTGYNLWQSHDYQQETEATAGLMAAAQVQYKEITRTYPAAPTSSENLIKAVNVYQQVVRIARSPQPFLQLVSRAIEASPDIYLQDIDWNYGAEQPDAAPATAATVGASAAVGNTEELRQSGVLSGEVRPFHGDFRAAIESINRVAGRLAREPSVADVKIVKMPLNVNPEQSLTGDTRSAAEHTGNAQFKIQLLLKPNA